MKVSNMISSRGHKIANQFIITGTETHVDYREVETGDVDCYNVEYFQSYNSVIVKKLYKGFKPKITLDINKWDYSKTTGKYRNQFLNETKKETQAKIKSGEYILTDLNG